jgi:hypothetical protein
LIKILAKAAEYQLMKEKNGAALGVADNSI